MIEKQMNIQLLNFEASIINDFHDFENNFRVFMNFLKFLKFKFSRIHYFPPKIGWN